MFISKYGVARHIYIPIPKAGSANHAVGADWTPAAGDVKISKDGGAAANVTNLPTAIAMGNSAIWDFNLTATEMQAAQVVVTVADSATKAVDDTGFIIETHGNASAQFQVDLADGVRAGLTALPNAAAEASGGLPTLSAAQASNGTINANVHRWLTGTPLALSSQQVQAVVPDSQKVDLNTIKTQTVTCAAGVTVLASVGTAATSTAQTGDSYALANGLSGFVAIKGDTAAIKLKTDNLPSDPADASDIASAFSTVNTTLATIASYIDTEVGLIKAKTDNLPASPAATGDAMTLTAAYDFAKGTVAMTEGYAADGAAFSPTQAFFMIWSALSEFAISGTTITAKKLDGSTSAMTFTLDDATNPTSRTRAT